MAKSYITLDTRIDGFKDQFNNLVNKVGDLATLTTTGDSDLVQAINEHSAELGTITAGAMGTTASTVSTAIAELDAEADSDRSNFGANVKNLMLMDGTSKHVTVTANNSTDETVYLTFVDGATDSQGIETDTGLTYNPSSGNLGIAGQLTAATLDISGNIDIDGITNLDAVDIDGAVQLDNTLTVGVDDTGYDVKFFGATAGHSMEYDASQNSLKVIGASGTLGIESGQLILGSTTLTSTAAELNLLDGVSGLVQADFTKLAAVTSSAAEINLLDGVSGLVQADFTKLAAVDATATELNIMDGDTSATSTTIADADRVVVNDAGTMKQVAVTDLAAYFDDEITAMPNLVTTAATTVGALNSGSITSGFGNIDIGASTFTTTGTVNAGAITLGDAALSETELEILDGATVTTAELNILDGATVTVAELNIMDGDADGSSAITVADTDAFVMNDGGTMRQVDASLLKAYFGQAAEGTALSSIDINGAATITSLQDADEIPIHDNSADSNRNTAMSTVKAYVLAGKVTDAAQTNITSLGNLDSAQIDNITINGSTIGHVSDTDLINIASGQVTVAGEMQVTTLDIGGTNVTATAAELNILDGVTSTTAELNLLDGSTANTVVNSKAVVYGSSGQLAGTLSTAAQGNITSLGTLSTLTVDDITINGSTISDDSDLTIDAGGQIILDAGGSHHYIKFYASGDEAASIKVEDAGVGDTRLTTFRAGGTNDGMISNNLTIKGNNPYDGGTDVDFVTFTIDGNAKFGTVSGIDNATVHAGTFTGALSGNATTATALATGRTIGMTGDVVWTSASFTGAGNVTGSATIQSSAVETAMIANDAVTGAKIADDTVAEANMADDAIGSAQMKTLRTLIINDSDGNAQFTMYGAGA